MSKRASSPGILGVGLAAFLGLSIAGTMAQSGNAVRIDSDDIGGVVTSAKGPEAGVWVIAETTDLPTQADQDRRHRRSRPLLSSPTCRRRTTASGCAATGWWIRRRCTSAPGKMPEPDGGDCARRARRRRILPGQLLVCAAQPARQERVPRHRAQGQRHLGSACRRRRSGSTTSRPAAARRVTRWATRRRARSPRPWACSIRPWRHGIARLQVRASTAAPTCTPTPTASAASACLAMFADWTDRIAAGEYPARGAAAAAGRRAQRRHHAVGLGRPAPVLPRRGRQRQAQPERQRERPGVRRRTRTSSDHMSILDPVAQRRQPGDHPGRSIRSCRPGPTKIGVPSPYWGEEVVLEQPGDHAQQRRWIRRDGCGTRPGSGRPLPTRRSARKARRIRRRSCSRSTPAAGSTPSTTRRRSSSRSSIPASARSTSTSPTTPTTRSGRARAASSAGSTRRCWTRPATSRRSQGWAPLILDTNGNGKQDAWVEPGSAGRSDQGQADRRRASTASA